MLTCSMFTLSCSVYDDIKVSGNLNYTKQTKSRQEVLKNAIELKYRKNLHEDVDKKYLFYIGGNIGVDQDIFNNTSKVNAMSSLGVDF